MKIGSKETKVASEIKLLELRGIDKLHFEQPMNGICKLAANQVNTFIRSKCFKSFQERKVIVNSFVISNFNYSTLVWIFASSKSLTKIENLHKKALLFMLNG